MTEEKLTPTNNEEPWPLSEIPDEKSIDELAQEAVDLDNTDNAEEIEQDGELEDAVEVKNYQDTDTEDFLIFELSEKEKAYLATEATTLNRKLKEKEKEFDLMKKKYKGEISEFEIGIRSFFEVIENGEEAKVHCIKRVHFDKEIVEFIYKGEVKKTRVMRENERQLELLESTEADADDFISSDDAMEAGLGEQPDEVIDLLNGLETHVEEKQLP